MSDLLSDSEMDNLIKIHAGIIRVVDYVAKLNALARDTGFPLTPVDPFEMRLVKYEIEQLFRNHERAETEIKKSAMALLEKNIKNNVSNFETKRPND
jgi:hypothetical protein